MSTILVHHAGKGRPGDFQGGDFRGSSKLAATFEHIIRLTHQREDVEHGTAEFNVTWQKHRGGGRRQPKVHDVFARLVTVDGPKGAAQSRWQVFERGADTRDGRIFDMWDRMQERKFATQDEMAAHYDVSPSQIGRDIKDGVAMGVWPSVKAAQDQLKKVGRERRKRASK